MQRTVYVGETFLGKCDLTLVEVAGEKPGPVIGLLSGVHGDETTSVGGLIRLLEFLSALPRRALGGKIIAIPYANPFGLRARERGVKGADLNRSFPGAPEQGFHNRLAHAIMSVFCEVGVDLVVDLHTMNPLSIPFIIIDRVRVKKSLFQKTVSLAESCGLGVVYDLLRAEYAKKSLFGSCSSQFLCSGIPSFTIETPGVFYSPSEGEDFILLALLNLLRSRGIIPSDKSSKRWMHPSKKSLGILRRRRCSGPFATRAGFFRRRVEPGDPVFRGQLLGEILYTSSPLLFFSALFV